MRMKAWVALCTFMVVGCGAGVEGALEDAPPQDSSSAEALEPGQVEMMKIPPDEDDPLCGPEDEYYYETTSYSSQQSYLWQCQGYAYPGGPFVRCNTYKVCQVEDVYMNYGLCVGDVLYGYRRLKSSTVTTNCYNTSINAATGMACPNPLYGGYCY
ncbi:hypothetical protein [Corallococcus sp. M7]